MRSANERYRPSHSDVDSASPRHSASPTPFPPSSENDDDAQDGPTEPQEFQGNYFGDYTPMDFENYNEYDAANAIESDSEEVEGEWECDGVAREGDEDGGAEEDAEEEEDAMDYQEEGSWEPPTQGDEGVGVDMEEDTFDVSDETALPPDMRATQQRTQECLRAKMFIIPFPNPKAASPSSAKEPSAYDHYQTQADPEGENLYHPFTTRLDWEIARWAKMRGPGSTAVTELLAIKGVSLQFILH